MLKYTVNLSQNDFYLILWIIGRKSRACKCPDTNAAAAVCPASKWLTFELGITQPCWATCSQPQHSSPYSSSLSLSFSPFSVDPHTGLWQAVRQVRKTESAYHYLLPAVPGASANYSHSSCYSTVTEQLLVLHRHNRQQRRETRARIEEKEKQP